MKRKKVKSSNILSVGYNKKDKLLEIEFTGGGVYQYENVGPDVYMSLMAAESVGGFFSRNIRTGGYKFKKMLKDDKKEKIS